MIGGRIRTTGEIDIGGVGYGRAAVRGGQRGKVTFSQGYAILAARAEIILDNGLSMRLSGKSDEACASCRKSEHLFGLQTGDRGLTVEEFL